MSQGQQGGRGGFAPVVRTVQTRLEKLIAEGKTLDVVLAAKPTDDFDAAWGQGFLKPDRWVEINYRGMTAR